MRIRNSLKTTVVFLAILFLGLALRLYLAPLAVHGDLVMQSGWGWWIREHGFRGFYENNVWIYGWPNHPPLASLMYGLGFNLYLWLNTLFTNISTFIALHRIVPTKFLWWFNFVNWFGGKTYELTPYKYGEFISLKLFPIAGDLLVAAIIYGITVGLVGRKKSLLLTIAYLFSPFSWYLSAFWGQSDQLAFFFALGSFLLLYGKFSVLAPILLAISIGLKPTSFIFVPLFFWFARGEKKRVAFVAVGSTAALFLYYLLVRGLTDLTFINFNRNLQAQMFAKGEWWTWANAFNFWHLVTGYLTSSWEKFLFIPYKAWGYAAFGLFYLLALIVGYKRNLKTMLISLFIVSFAAWHTMVTMHERYLYPVLPLGLILVAYNKRLFKYWVILSLIFVLNLYNDWWAPVSIQWVRDLMMWQDRLMPRVLSLINVVLFIKMTTLLVSWSEIKGNSRLILDGALRGVKGVFENRNRG